MLHCMFCVQELEVFGMESGIKYLDHERCMLHASCPHFALQTVTNDQECSLHHKEFKDNGASAVKHRSPIGSQEMLIVESNTTTTKAWSRQNTHTPAQ
jgi:hypothetical protein